jgi:hypothetical protein
MLFSASSMFESEARPGSIEITLNAIYAPSDVIENYLRHPSPPASTYKFDTTSSILYILWILSTDSWSCFYLQNIFRIAAGKHLQTSLTHQLASLNLIDELLSFSLVESGYSRL